MLPEMQPTSPVAQLTRRLEKIERFLRESASTYRMLESATIGAGGLSIVDGGKIVVYAPSSVGTFEGGQFGVRALDAFGNLVYPATGFVPQGILADAGPDLGSVVIGVDPVTGGAVVSATNNRVFLSYGTTGSGANVRLDLNGELKMVTSARRAKTNITDADVDVAALEAQHPVWFRMKGEVAQLGDDAPTYIGLIADDLYSSGLAQFVELDTDGNVRSLQYDRLGAVGVIAVAKKHGARLTALETSSTDTERLQEKVAAQATTIAARGDALAAQGRKIAALEKATIHRSAIAVTPALTLGNPRDVTVKWPRPLPDADYLVDVSLLAGGKATVKTGTTKTKDQCVLTVETTAALGPLLGSQLLATAHYEGTTSA